MLTFLMHTSISVCAGYVTFQNFASTCRSKGVSDEKASSHHRLTTISHKFFYNIISENATVGKKLGL